MRRVCVLGLGYIGLPTAILIARSGYQVIGVDTDEAVVEMLNRGASHLREADVDALLKEVYGSGNFFAKTEPEEADAYIIAVPTPFDEATKQADLTHVKLAANMISPYLKRNSIVIVESTVPPRSFETLLIPLFEKAGLKADEDFDLVYCPERAMPSDLINEMIHNDRIIGASNERAANAVKALYSGFVKGSIHITTVRTAEMCKVIENAYRDVNIALANELALIAEELQINIWEAIELANKHPRVNILRPGPGVGGHCIAIDPWFLCCASRYGDLIRAAREINDAMPDHVVEIAKQIITSTVPTITILGLAYKANVNDYRSSPSLRIIDKAKGFGWDIKIHDPLVEREFEYPLLRLGEAVRDSDCIILVTDHSSFKNLDPAVLGPSMRQKNVIDTRDVLDREKWELAGFTYRLLGRGVR